MSDPPSRDLELMQDLEDDSIDLVLTDPPYGVGIDYGGYDDNEDNWYRLFDNLIPECKRVASMSIIQACKIDRLQWIYNNHPPDWLISWYKGSTGCVSKIGFNDWEPILVYGRNKGINMHDYMNVRPKPFDNGHPCPKPVDWAYWIIKRATREGDIVLDPFLGSGTTAVACKQLDRRYIGFELNPKYCRIAEKRLAQSQLRDYFG